MRKTRLTERDYQIIESISYWKSLTAEQLGQLHFSESNNSCALARRRLQKLMQIKNIHVYRKDILSKNIYYMGNKRANYQHDLYIVDAFIDIKSKYQIIKYKREYTIPFNNTSLKADLMVVCKDDKGELKVFIIEIQNQKVYKDKWTEYINNGYWQQLFGVRPQIIVYSRFNSYKSLIPIIFKKLE